MLLDADNTLFDFDKAEGLALQWLIHHLGLPDPAKECYLAINRALWHLHDLGKISGRDLVVERFRRFLNEMGLEGDPVELNRAYLQKLGECPELLPGAEELCRTLMQHCTLAIVTNGMPAVQHSRMEHSAIHDCFRGLFISDEMDCRKPEQREFELGFRGLGLTEAEAEEQIINGFLK